MADETVEKVEVKVEERPEPLSLDEFRSELAWARKELSKTREEAARYRTERNKLRDDMKNVKSMDEFTALEQRMQETEKAYAREQLVNRYASNLPAELRDSVAWPDDEAGVKDLANRLGQFTVMETQGQPSGGLGRRGDSMDSEVFDPADIASHIPR